MHEDEYGGIVTVSTELLADALKLPAGTKIIGAEYRPDLRAIRLWLAGDEQTGLPAVAEGEEYPTVTLVAEHITTHFVH